MAVIFAHFQASGRVPVDKEQLNSLAMLGAISCAVSFSIRGLMLSGPLALFGLRFWSISFTVWVGTLILSRAGMKC